MKLWLLKAIDEHPTWQPWYDKAFGFVVRAGSERLARMIASRDAGDEEAEPWLDEKQTTCVELVADGDAKIVLKDFWAA